jgi:simple sugar transport system ATP-binding protein
VDLDRLVGELSVADKQLVAISRALLHDARIVIMDEPTTALTQHEVTSLFDVIRDLKAEGIATLFVSHKLREVLDISEKLTVLRNGRKVAEGDTREYDEAKITYHMTGRQVSDERFAYQGEPDAEPVLRVNNLSLHGSFDAVSFDVYPGEIVGITGLLGSGRTELALSLFGVHPATGGTVEVDGQPVRIDSIKTAVNHGIAYVPEDRLTEGLFLEQSIARNIFVSILDRIKTAINFVDFAAAKETVDTWISDLKIATPSAEVPAMALSGGNQQRIVLARWLAAGSRVLILNGPTVGVDVGSKEEIHRKLRELATRGVAIVIMSDDVPEIVQNCNRIFVMHKGSFVHEFTEGFDDDALISQFEQLK